MIIDSDGGMVKNGMKLSPDQDHVYVLTDTKVCYYFLFHQIMYFIVMIFMMVMMGM